MMKVEPSSLDRFGNGEAGVHRKVGQVYQNWREANPDKTIGWEPSCQCIDGPFPDFLGDREPTVGTCSFPQPIPCTVLDPFAGSGTTLRVARRMGLHSIGIELNPDYAVIAQARVMERPKQPGQKPAKRIDPQQKTLF